jgi:hypothetical protein
MTNKRGDHLSKPVRATKENRRSAVHQDKKAHQSDAMCYPKTPFLPKSTSSQHIQQEIPVHMIISLLNIQLAKQPWITGFETTIQGVSE